MIFFVRGRGHGHAIPDMAIADELAKLRNDIQVTFVSYGTGAATLIQHERPVVDLQMPDSNSLWETVVRAGRVISQMRPVLVVSHEEFAVLPLAKLFDVPAVFITEWFIDPEDLLMQTLRYADEVVFIGEEGIFEEPPFLEGKVYYAGPVLRRFDYSRSDRERARDELGFPKELIILLVLPGGWATEEKEPIFDIVMPAFNLLRAPSKLLVWVGGPDCEELTHRLRDRGDVIVKGYERQIDRLMVASDLAITKANRRTVRELAALGVRSISISHGENPIDDTVIERIPTNTSLDARTANPRMLAECMLDALASPPPANPGPRGQGGDSEQAAARAAQRLLCHVDREHDRKVDGSATASAG